MYQNQIDLNLYQHMFRACGVFLNNNLDKINKDMANLFMREHDPANGNQVQQGVSNLYNFFSNAMRNAGGSLNDNQLYTVAANYVDAFIRMVVDKQRQSSGFGMNNFSGMSNNNGGNFNLGMNNNNSYSSFNNAPGSHLLIGGNQPTPSPQVQPQPSVVSSQPMVQPTSYTDNPIEQLAGDKPNFHSDEKSPNWGYSTDVDDNRITFMRKKLIRSGDGRLSINNCIGFGKTFTSNPMDIVRDFFKVVPDTFLADYFTFKIFYNHIERVEIPTDQFLGVRKKFSEALTKNTSASPYDTIIAILNDMTYGPRKSLVEYLTKLINRMLWTSFGYTGNVGYRIEFTDIEDLNELLGTGYSDPILNIPNAKMTVSAMINTVILNALTMYSDVMFYNVENDDIDVLKVSNVFPSSIPGVYGNKQMIPSSGSPEAKLFYDAMYEYELSKATYVRSIRSVVITNTLSSQILSSVTDRPGRFVGQVARILNEHVIEHRHIETYASRCRIYDIGRSGNSVSDYQKYRDDIDSKSDVGVYETQINSFFTDAEIPKIPVDQTLFAIQYKKSPKDYLVAMDICTTLDVPEGDPAVILSLKNMDDLKITQ